MSLPITQKKDPVLKVNFEAEESDIVKLYTPSYVTNI